MMELGALERGQSLVGRVALIPTMICIKEMSDCSMKFLYANVLLDRKHLIYACLRRDEGNPTYGFLLKLREVL